MNRSLIFGDIEVSKIQFYDTKKAIKLNLADVNNIAVSSSKYCRPVNILLVIYMTLVKVLLLYVLFYH